MNVGMSDIKKYHGILLAKLDELIPGQLYKIKIPLYEEYHGITSKFPTLGYGEKILLVGEDQDKYRELIHVSSRAGCTWALLDQGGRKWWDFEEKLKWKLVLYEE